MRTGDGHKRILKKARDFPKDYTVVYFFGSHELYVSSALEDEDDAMERADADWMTSG